MHHRIFLAASTVPLGSSMSAPGVQNPPPLHSRSQLPSYDVAPQMEGMHLGSPDSSWDHGDVRSPYGPRYPHWDIRLFVQSDMPPNQDLFECAHGFYTYLTWSGSSPAQPEMCLQWAENMTWNVVCQSFCWFPLSSYNLHDIVVYYALLHWVIWNFYFLSIWYRCFAQRWFLSRLHNDIVENN